ncbi:MAG: hypothetical protein ACLUOS_15385 [Odoribacter splanchnicus]
MHFLNEEDAEAHDLLICLNTRKDIDDPTRMRYTRQEWFKTTQEMIDLFPDLPEAIENTQEITDKVEEYELDRSFDARFSYSPRTRYGRRIPAKFFPGRPLQRIHPRRRRKCRTDRRRSQQKIKKLGGYDRLYRIKLEADYLKELTMKGL